MTKRIILILMLIIALLTILIIILSIQQRQNVVVKVIDGDTFLLKTGQKVRLIGIDTPEKGEYYYEEAKEALEELTLNKIVVLERDISNYDKYNRLLRYVYLDGEMINLYLVTEGYAEAKEYYPDVRYASDLKEAENDAIVNQLGIWYIEEEGDDLCLDLGCPQGTDFIGSINSNKYHECDSRFARVILPENIVCFTSEEHDLEEGYIST